MLILHFDKVMKEINSCQIIMPLLFFGCVCYRMVIIYLTKGCLLPNLDVRQSGSIRKQFFLVLFGLKY